MVASTEIFLLLARLVVDQLLTFKEQQLPDQERVGSRSPPPPEPTYGPIPEQGQPPRSSQHRKGHQPANPDHERKGRFSTRQPACIPHQGGKKKSHHFFSTVLGSTDGDSKYEGPPNSTGSLTFKFKSRKPKRQHLSLQLQLHQLHRNRQHHEHHLQHSRLLVDHKAASKKRSGRRFVKAGQTE